MRTWKTACLSTLLVALAACDDDASDTSTASAVGAAPTEVKIEISGDQTLTFESSGSLFCGESNLGGEPYYFELYAMKPPYQFNMRFPRSIGPGTHSIHGSDDPESNSDADGNAYFYWQGENRVRFDRVSNGELVLESVPSAQGERLIGSISADLSNDEGGSIRFDAVLDLDAGSQSFDECP